MSRSRAFDRVRTFSAVSTSPCLTRMIGFTESSVPMAACVPLIRPPFLRYSRVSRATYMTMSVDRVSSTSAISAADVRRSASSTPIRARIPSAIDAPSESTTWISRSGSMSRAIWALLIVPDKRAGDVDRDDRLGAGREGGLIGLLELAR